MPIFKKILTVSAYFIANLQILVLLIRFFKGLPQQVFFKLDTKKIEITSPYMILPILTNVVLKIFYSQLNGVMVGRQVK